MVRSPRAIAPLIRSLLFGTAATLVVASLPTVLVSCQDESQPEYWTKKLEDPAWQPRAVKRLEQFFEDAMTNANKNLEAPEVKQLLDKIIDPLVKVYVDGYADLDTKTRNSVVQLLSSTRDKRAIPALTKAFTEFAKSPKTTTDEADIKWAVRAAGEMQEAALSGPMLDAFIKLKASTMLGGVTYKDFSAAMLKVPNPAWAGPLRQLLDPPIDPPKTKEDQDKIDSYRDQLFWQITAADVLGVLRDKDAVEPLMKVLLDPDKVDAHATALIALVKIGKPATDVALKLLKGEAKALQDFHVKRLKDIANSAKDPEGTPWVAYGALVLGTAGRTETIPGMVEVLKSEKDDSNRAVILRELAKIPATPESKAAFKEGYESLSLETAMPPAGPALATLTESAAHFFDPEMVDWLLEHAAEIKGDADDKKELQGAAAVAAMKIAKPSQMRAVKRAIARHGGKAEKDALALSEKIVGACGDKVECYLEAIGKSENQGMNTQFAGIKAGYMIAVLGDAGARDKLVKSLDNIENAAVRFTAALAIDHLTPKGSTQVADQLEQIIEANSKGGDKNRMLGDKPLKDVMTRLRSRAS